MGKEALRMIVGGNTGKKFIIVLMILLFTAGMPLSVQAKEASVTYGSEGYEATAEDVFKIGVYIHADSTDFIYDVNMQYDPEKLEYLGGADGGGNGSIQFSGHSDSEQKKYMLLFRALAEGESSVSITGANVVVNATAVPTEGENQDSAVPAAAQITAMASAPVTIRTKEQTQEQAEELPEESTEEQTQEAGQSETLSVPVAPKETETIEAETAVESIEESAALAVTETAVPEDEISDMTVGLGLREISVVGFLTGCVILMFGSLVTLLHLKRMSKKETKEEEDTETEYFDAEEEEDEWLDLDDDDAWKRWAEEVEEAEEEMAEEMAKQKTELQPAPTVERQAPVIRINDVSMHFKISEANASSLKEYLLATLKRQNRYHELIALNHINFEIEKGEVVGIIGTNGSGKSTLLKLVAGALGPTEGKVEVDRKKVQLLTLGTGFDTELTARENVYLNGAIIGYSREFIEEHYDEIVEFAELEGFMDEKIKNFSSGMVSRLGFAIATVGQTAEILILDEVLSVGDMFFRKKSEKRIKEMIHSGSTVLIVSHSIDTIVKNCTKAVWIEKGVLKEIGEPKKVCEAYKKLVG